MNCIKLSGFATTMVAALIAAPATAHADYLRSPASVSYFANDPAPPPPPPGDEPPPPPPDQIPWCPLGVPQDQWPHPCLQWTRSPGWHPAL
jgi:hypothetical protein